MLIKTVSEIVEEGLVNKDFKYFQNIDFRDGEIKKIISEFDRDERLVEILNGINNQGITDISFKTWDVWREGYEKYSIAQLSTAERLFTLAYIADKFKIKVWVVNEVTELSKKNVKYFLKLFKDSEYVNIAMIEDMYAIGLNKMKQGV